MPMTIGQALTGAGGSLGAGIRRGGALKRKAMTEEEEKRYRDFMTLLGLSGKVSPGSLDPYMTQVGEGQGIDYTGLAKHLGEYQAEQEGYGQNLKILKTALSNVQNLMGVDISKVTGEADMLSAAIAGKGRRLTKEAEVKTEKEKATRLSKERAEGRAVAEEKRAKVGLGMRKGTAARARRRETAGLKTARKKELKGGFKEWNTNFLMNLGIAQDLAQIRRENLMAEREAKDTSDYAKDLIDEDIGRLDMSMRLAENQGSKFRQFMNDLSAGKLTADQFKDSLRSFGVDDSMILEFGELYSD